MFRELHKAMSFTVSNRPLSLVKYINRNSEWLYLSTRLSVVCVAWVKILRFQVTLAVFLHESADQKNTRKSTVRTTESMDFGRFRLFEQLKVLSCLVILSRL